MQSDFGPLLVVGDVEGFPAYALVRMVNPFSEGISELPMRKEDISEMSREEALALHGFWINQPESPERELMLTLTEKVYAGTIEEYDPVGNGYDASDPKGWSL